MMNKVPNLPAPPRAEQRPHSYTRHGFTIEDPWAWIRDPGYPDVQDKNVLAYLKAENDYFEAAMAPHKALTDQLFEEMKGRIKEDDSSVPIKDGDWLYWWAFKAGTQYRDWYRKPAAGGDDTLIYSENAEAEGKEYYRLGPSRRARMESCWQPWPMTTDRSGSSWSSATWPPAKTSRPSPTSASATRWDQRRQDRLHRGQRPVAIYRAQYHRIEDKPAKAVTLYEEKDDIAFSVGAARSTDDSLIFIRPATIARMRCVSCPPTGRAVDDDQAAPAGRHREADAAHGRLWILTNDDHVNFRVATADPSSPGEWSELIAGRRHLSTRRYQPPRPSAGHQPGRRPRPAPPARLRQRDQERVPFEEASYSASFAGNPEFAPASYRLSYSSMVTPGTVYDYHPAEQRLETRKVQEIPSG